MEIDRPPPGWIRATSTGGYQTLLHLDRADEIRLGQGGSVSQIYFYSAGGGGAFVTVTEAPAELLRRLAASKVP